MAVSRDPQRGHSVWSVAATATAESCGPRWAGEAAAGHQAPLRTRTGSLLSARTFTTSTRTLHPGKATRQEGYQHLPAGDTLLHAGEKKNHTPELPPGNIKQDFRDAGHQRLGPHKLWSKGITTFPGGSFSFSGSGDPQGACPNERILYLS